MKINILLFTLFLAGTSLAQKAVHADYNWQKTPAKYTATESELKKDEVILFEKRSIEVLEEGENMVEYTLVHIIRLINTDIAIERNNKMYIGNSGGDDVVFQKARVIKVDGSIAELKESDIQEAKDEDGNVTERYFALDGLEKGCVVEYLHFIKSGAEFTGAVIYQQGKVDKRRFEMEVIIPKHLEYVFYPMNGMKTFELDSTKEEYNRSFVVADNVEGVMEEDWSPYNASLQKCYYKLNKNLNSNKANFYTYANVSKFIHGDIYAPTPKKTVKKMKAMIKAIKVEASTTEEIVRAMEYKLKSEINVLEFNFDEGDNLTFVLDKKLTSASGMTKLMAQMLKLMDIEHEIVLTINNNDAVFPADYEAYNFLSEYMIYINELNMFMGTDIFSRLGFPPSELTNTRGLFIEDREMNGMSFPVAKVKEIKGPVGDLSVDEINTKVSFPGDLKEPKIEIERIASGYKAIAPQFYLDFVEEDRKKEAKEEFLKYVDDDAILENEVYENDNSKVAGTKPFIGRADFVGRSFIEQAGNKILLKAGLLIGPQAEMYNKEERKLPVLAGHTRQYKRQITIIIPQGYSIKNPDDLNFNVLATNKEDAGFISSYKINGNVLTVTVFEYYNKVQFSVAEYLNYEKVINAAADFNKIVLVLDKN
jgi:hypothetical protein